MFGIKSAIVLKNSLIANSFKIKDSLKRKKRNLQQQHYNFFYDKEILKAGSNHTCLSVILNDSILKKKLTLNCF